MNDPQVSTVTVRRVHPSGAWQLQAVIDWQLFHRTYYGFSRAESVTLFRETVRRAGYGAWRLIDQDGGQ